MLNFYLKDPRGMAKSGRHNIPLLNPLVSSGRTLLNAYKSFYTVPWLRITYTYTLSNFSKLLRD